MTDTSTTHKTPVELFFVYHQTWTDASGMSWHVATFRSRENAEAFMRADVSPLFVQAGRAVVSDWAFVRD